MGTVVVVVGAAVVEVVDGTVVEVVVPPVVVVVPPVVVVVPSVVVVVASVVVVVSSKWQAVEARQPASAGCSSAMVSGAPWQFSQLSASIDGTDGEWHVSHAPVVNAVV